VGDVKRADRLNKTAIEERRAKVSGLYLHGQTMRAIARTLGVSVGTVAGDLQKIRAEWKAEQLDNLGEVIERDLMMLLTIDGEAAQQFSKTHGAEWLAVRLRAIGQRAQLLGLNKPHRQEISGPGGNPIEYRQCGAALDSKLARLAAALAAEPAALDADGGGES
jgi:hypothetical protein